MFALLLSFAALSIARDFTYYDFEEMREEIFALESQYPNLLKVTSAQELYGLASPGNCGSEDCKQYIVHLTNFETYEAEKVFRPEVFFSGCLHGDERVGPTTLVESIKLLTEAHDSGDNAWLKRLVDTRSIFFMPATNALGYFQNSRTENGIDPNRDFAFDRTDEDCMNSITARSVNELWRDHMFQLAITFHSGIRMIGYEWGDETNGFDYTSPDQNAQASIGAALSAYAGTFDSASRPRGVPRPELYDRLTYPQGPITPLLYPVGGGMEDWGYAGSWAPNKNVCRPRMNGDYPVEKTEYTDAQLRVYNVLVESSSSKQPSESTFGNTAELLKPSGEGQGHLPRHIRLVLTMIEAVQPYIKFVGFNSIQNERHALSCSASTTEEDINNLAEADDVNGESVAVEAKPSAFVSVSYEVGGSFKVDSTSVGLYRKPEWLSANSRVTPEIREALEEYKVLETSTESGYTRWSGGGLFGSESSSKDQNILLDFSEIEYATEGGIDNREEFPFIPAWKFCITTPEEEGEYFILAQAIVDQDWSSVPNNSTPDGFTAQAHLAQARTNTSWVKENNGFVIKGQTEWFSQPLLVNVVAEQTTGGGDGNPDPIPDPDPESETETETDGEAEDTDERSAGVLSMAAGLLIVGLLVLSFFAYNAFSGKKTPVDDPNYDPDFDHYLKVSTL